MYNYTPMSRKMQVLLVTYFGLEQGGGVATATAMLATELARKNCQVFIAATEAFDFPDYPQIKTILLPTVRQIPHLARRDQLLTRVLQKIITENQIDLIHATDDRYVGVAAIQAAHNCHRSVVQDFRDYWFCCLKGDLLFQNRQPCTGLELNKCLRCLHPAKTPWTAYKYYHWQKRLPVFARADLKLPVSQAVADQLQRFGLATNSHVFYDTLPEFDQQGRSFDPVKITSLLKLYQLTDKTIVFFAGRLIYHRGIKVLLETALLLQKSNPKIHFLIAGDGELRDYINDFVTAHQLRNLTLLGQISPIQMADFYQLADLVFFPSQLHEPFSRTVLEAVFYELPVVTSNLGGLKELITDGQNGFLIDPQDPIQATEKILQIALNSRTQIKMSAANHERQKDFSRRQYFDRLLTHYQDLIAQYVA